MYVAIRHEISDSNAFWEKASSFVIPPDIKLLYSFPNQDGAKGNCLWEAESVAAVKKFVEGNLGQFSINEYYEVNPNNSIGIQ
ncbi:hypothetical protein BOW53_15875 [Solemya pervernicosa gill symbiont]|uniref:DUF4242 domain-containing protein n=2 Tax=Gammaproteobacteria incertae sedis TaxID=118884 RepID=A0A1T2KZT4_9GAMM|nr:hypothetical protein [Candidatus Reidiella endopervernicosa]OOZ38348.1 hypothetical protein BOW53_15875 [Solemya pervernicosa gill symbiont]QKQ26537.1 hypothetical protein HUE57_09780 [Candidatus Reidiella endopervernicosa]